VSAPLPLLLLFDIDGTLLIGGATGHGAAMHVAFARVFGVADARRHVVPYAGRTDLEIARELLALSGVEVGPERLAELERAWVTAYEEIVEDDLSDRVAPGMVALLERLAARDDVRLALLTGNLEPIARLKLARAGIGGLFRGGQGAFGSDSWRRPELPAVARARAGEARGGGAPWPRNRTLIIGDTPLDVACARADGVRVLGLAGGAFSMAELHEADAAAEDAEQLEALIEGEVGRVGR